MHYKRRYIRELLKRVLYTVKLPIKVWHVNLKAIIDSLIKKPKIDKLQ
jgi:hypothetical protein